MMHTRLYKNNRLYEFFYSTSNSFFVIFFLSQQHWGPTPPIMPAVHKIARLLMRPGLLFGGGGRLLFLVSETAAGHPCPCHLTFFSSLIGVVARVVPTPRASPGRWFFLLPATCVPRRKFLENVERPCCTTDERVSLKNMEMASRNRLTGGGSKPP